MDAGDVAWELIGECRDNSKILKAFLNILESGVSYEIRDALC